MKQKVEKSLHLKIAILVLSVLTFLAGVTFYIQYRLTAKQLTDSMEASAEHLSNSLKRSFEIAMLGRRLDEIQQALEEIGRDPHIKRIFIVNKSGEIKVSSERQNLGKVMRISEKTCQACHMFAPSEREKSIVIDTGEEKYLRSVNPIEKKPICESCHLDQAKILGVLVTDISTAEIEALTFNNLKISFIMFFITVILVAGAFRVGFKRIILDRLLLLKNAAAKMEIGDFSIRITPPSRDELGRLADSFNRMADNLQLSLEKIESARSYLENLINTIDDGVAVVKRGKTFVLLNDKYLQMFDKSTEDRIKNIGAKIDNLNIFHGEWCESDERKCNICRVFENGRFSNRVSTYISGDGTERTYESYVSVISRDEKGVYEVVEDLRDITLRKKLERQMMQTEKLASVGRLAAGVAHEINNPMASIATCAEGLLAMIENIELKNDLDKEILEYLQVIRSSAFRCKAITERLLNFSATQTGEFETLDLNKITQESVRLVEYDVAAKGVNLQLKLNPQIPQIKISRVAFPQVIVNLILNALYAVDRGGTIILETNLENGRVALTVSDDGIGISEKDLQFVFEPFYTTKKHGEGSGLGLSICRTIVNSHKGEISIRSQPGKGTTVMIVLPAGDNNE